MLVGVVGCGVWGRRVAARLARLPGVRVAVCVDLDADAADAAAKLAGSEAATTMGGLEALDGVCVCTPPGPGRTRLLRQLAELGVRRVRVEKPLGLSLRDAERMRSVAREHDLVVTPAVTPLYEAGWDVMRELAESWDRPSLHSYRVGTRRPAHSVPVAADLMIHDAAIHRFVMGAGFVAPKAAHGLFRSVVSHRRSGRVVGSMVCGVAAKGMRRHHLRSSDGRWAVLDEVERTVVVGGETAWTGTPDADPLGVELSAWLADEAFTLDLGVEACRVLGDGVLMDKAAAFQGVAL